MIKLLYFFGFITILFCSTLSFGQLFPNPATLSTGQGTPGNTDPIWTCSPWYATQPTDASGATFTPALINNNCAPGSWVNPSSLTAPMNNGNWITGQDANCATNTSTGYRFFRLELNLPADCNGFSVTQAGNYVLSFTGYVDNAITNVFLNNTPLGISGGSYAAGSQLNFSIVGPWQVGINYIDILIYNTPSGNPTDQNPYGLLLVADANSANGNDTDNDGISDLFDQCPCESGNNPVGCVESSFTCDVDMIRSAFTNAGCIELQGCWDDCSMYFLNPQSMTGSNAQAFAQNLGANLISIQSAAENACILSDLVRLNQTGVIWIGFNDEAVEGTFVWYDQSPVIYTNWASGEPNNSGGNEDCTQIYPSGGQPGTWNDLPCNSSNSKSIIEVNLCPVTNVTPPITMCQETNATIQVNSTILGSAPYTYSWNNNGSTQTSQTVSPMQSTNYIVTTEDRYKCSRKDTVFVTVNNKPVAQFSQNAMCQTTTNVDFTNESTVSGGGNLTSNWDFGNGQTSTTENPQNTFPSYGTYTTTLIVTAQGNCKDTATQTVSVFAKPTADYTFNANCSVNPQITFQNQSSSPDNSAFTSNWNFGNGQTSTDVNPIVTLPAPTGNSVTLIVTTPDNCKDTITKIVDANITPNADFTYNPACIGDNINFTNTTTIANNSNLSYNWNLGSGQTSTQTNPTASYTASGNQTVVLIATSANGCADTITKQVTVYPFPNAPQITSNSPVECPEDDFTFSGNVVSGASYFWSGPENFTSNTRENTITATEQNQGDYSLYITVNGCASDPAVITMSIAGKIVPLVADFPNVITPNGDGKNDFLDMNAYFSSCLPFKIEIYNRWGNKVFEQTSAGAVFEGKDQKSGNELSDGTYFYKLTYGSELRQGFITIAR